MGMIGPGLTGAMILIGMRIGIAIGMIPEI
jgi:hypothetical protein